MRFINGGINRASCEKNINVEGGRLFDPQKPSKHIGLPGIIPQLLQTRYVFFSLDFTSHSDIFGSIMSQGCTYSFKLDIKFYLWIFFILSDDYLVVNDSSTNQKELEPIFTVVSHEIVHQWIGNLVSIKWWADAWLKEGLTSYFEMYAMQEVSILFTYLCNHGIYGFFFLVTMIFLAKIF